MTDPGAWKREPAPTGLRPQRGGSPKPSETRYRDADVARLWEQLAAGENILLTAEKRVGKTAVLGLLSEQKTDQLWVVQRDVESVGTPKQLVELLCSDVRPLLPGVERAKQRWDRFITALGGSSIGPVTLPAFDDKDWQAHLNEMFDALAEHLDSEGRALVILWDEAPWMIAKIHNTCGWQTAADVLDQLRAVRQRHRCIRFLFTGSIGFHHVLRNLRDGRSHRASINDLRRAELPPLAPDDAGRLAWALLRWIVEHGTSASDPLPDLAEVITERCEGIPWFIHAAVDDLSKQKQPIDRASVDRVVDAARYSASDGWELRHYVDRVDEYYGADADLARAILDAVAVAVTRGTTATAIVHDLQRFQPPPSRDAVLDLLRLLHEDHYLVHEPPTWRFTYRLVMRAWIDLRDLEPETGGGS